MLTVGEKMEHGQGFGGVDLVCFGSGRQAYCKCRYGTISSLALSGYGESSRAVTYCTYLGRYLGS